MAQTRARGASWPHRRHLPLGIALVALLFSLIANPSITQAVTAKIKGSQITNNSIAAKKLKPAVRAKLNKVGEPGPQGLAGPQGPQGVNISLSSVSTVAYASAGVSNAFMCVGGTVLAKRGSTGTVTIVFHPTGQTGQFGANVGTYPMVNATATGAGYMANISDAANPGDPPATFTSITAYRVRVVDDEDVDVNASVRVVIF